MVLVDGTIHLIGIVVDFQSRGLVDEQLGRCGVDKFTFR